MLRGLELFSLVRRALVVVALIAVVAPVSAGAHEESGHAATNFDGRIPGWPDVKKVGDTTYRFLPEEKIYKVTRPGEPSKTMHYDPPSSAKAGLEVGAWVPLPTSELDPVCRNWGNRIIINYNGPDPVPVSTIRSAVRRMNWKIAALSSVSSSEARVVRMAVECDASGQVAVYHTEFPGITFGHPEGANAIKVLTYTAGKGGGASEVENSNVKNRENGSARYTEFPFIYQGNDGQGWMTHAPMHELFHSMGATQGYEVTPLAPYSTGFNPADGNGHHCVDGIDVMCYPDGASSPWGSYTETRCPESEGYRTSLGVTLDCGWDTYFDAAATPGTYLANYWNTGEPENPYLTTGTSTAPSAESLPPAIIKAKVGATSAEVQFRGGVVPNGDYATYWFEWGPTTSYGSKTEMSDAGWGTNQRIVRTTISKSITREQTYHYRVVAKNAAGTVYGADQTFAAKEYFDTPAEWDRWLTDDFTLKFGDVNGDGRQDIVARNSRGDRYVGLSNGSSFAAPVFWGSPWLAGSEFYLADVSGDGKADAIEESTTTGEIRVGVSTGSAFATPVKWTSVALSNDIYFADMNGDGIDDIVKSNPSTGERLVGLSTGTSFGFSNSWGIWNPEFTFHLADVNGDGKVDNVGRNGSGDVWVQLSTGSDFGSSVKWGVLTMEHTMTLADANGDGREDLVGKNLTTGERKVGLSSGTSFGALTNWGTWSPDSTYNFLLADVNGDGKADTVGRDSAGQVRVGVSTGSSFSASTTWAKWTGDYVSYVADVNGDGLDDLVARSTETGDRRVSLSTGASFAPATSWGTWNPEFTFHLADVNGDGKMDCLGRNGAGEIWVQLSTGSAFAASVKWGVLTMESTMTFTDVNGDGKEDLIGRPLATGERKIGLSSGTSFGALTNWGTWSPDSTYNFLLADVSGDGKSDTAGRDSAGQVRVGLSTGSSFAASTTWANLGSGWSSAYGMTFADVNGDGRQDLLGRNSSGDRQVELSTGSSFGAPLVWGGMWSSSPSLLFGDVNGDGRADSVGFNSDTGEAKVGLAQG